MKKSSKTVNINSELARLRHELYGVIYRFDVLEDELSNVPNDHYCGPLPHCEFRKNLFSAIENINTLIHNVNKKNTVINQYEVLK